MAGPSVCSAKCDGEAYSCASACVVGNPRDSPRRLKNPGFSWASGVIFTGGAGAASGVIVTVPPILLLLRHISCHQSLCLSAPQSIHWPCHREHVADRKSTR